MMSSDALRPTSQARKVLGKLATRLEEVKNPWRPGASTLELSHNETARLATDALLEAGEKEYRRVLSEERELNFLSSLEIRYITENAAKNSSTDNGSHGADRDYEGDTVSELTSGTYFPMMSDEEPPLLELGWPEHPQRCGPSETQIYFQRDKTQNVKDLIRSLINKAKKVIALVMDIFTDVDLFCDLMEASNKRRVPVYILLDEKNLSYFMDMCNALDVQYSHLSNMRIRSVCGDTYCTKSGKKFTGQVQEKFMIIDCEEVITGSYSFTWLSGQVHSNMVLHFSGGVTDSFDREFRCLYADSQIIERFHNPEEEGLPYYPYNMVHFNMPFDFMQDQGSREKVYSEHSSSPSSNNSVSSVKVAPGMHPPSYKVTQEKTEPSKATERRGSLNTVQQTLQGANLGKVSSNGTVLNPTDEHKSHGVSQKPEWTKPGSTEYLRGNLGGSASKFQGLGMYNNKNYFNNNPKTPTPTQHNPTESKLRSPPNPLFNNTPKTPLSTQHNPVEPKQRSPPNLVNKFSELFTGNSKKDSYNFKRSPPQSMGTSDLSPKEPESKQGLPLPAPFPVDHAGKESWINRRDEKRMTLGHSKLDLVNQYNKMKSKQVYSRFELKNNVVG
ncbi:protein FAM83C [Chanos chanos]|uniref:Protein FAM83C n=1 Tax=Chanos chanos TaxID=29144 RepID=A0A6J2VUR2_CHACN|nr:protein FAM83C [Chanos chanos]